MARTSIIADMPGENVYRERGRSLRDFLHVLFKRKWVILLFFIGTTITVTALTLLFTQPVYQATAQILVGPGREHIADLTLPTGGNAPHQRPEPH